MNRALSPTESDVLKLVRFPVTKAQVAHLLSQQRGKPVPESTVQTSLANLARWGRISQAWQVTPRRNARRRIYTPLHGISQHKGGE